MQHFSFSQQTNMFKEKLCFIKQDIDFEWEILVLLSNTNIFQRQIMCYHTQHRLWMENLCFSVHCAKLKFFNEKLCFIQQNIELGWTTCIQT